MGTELLAMRLPYSGVVFVLPAFFGCCLQVPGGGGVGMVVVGGGGRGIHRRV